MQSFRQKIFELLAENPKLRAKSIAERLDLSKKDYEKLRQQIYNACSEWRKVVRKHRVSKLSNLAPVGVHYGWFWLYLPVGCRESFGGLALDGGWRLTRSRNRFLLFVDREFGSVRWFETDRVSLRVRVPVNYGRAKTLFTLAFGRVLPVDLLVKCHDFIRFKGADYVFEIPGVKLPKFRIKMFQKSNAVEVFSDASHLGKLEMRVFYPDYAEKSEQTVKEAMAQIEAFKVLIEGLVRPANNARADRGIGRV